MTGKICYKNAHLLSNIRVCTCVRMCTCIDDSLERPMRTDVRYCVRFLFVYFGRYMGTIVLTNKIFVLSMNVRIKGRVISYLVYNVSYGDTFLSRIKDIQNKKANIKRYPIFQMMPYSQLLNTHTKKLTPLSINDNLTVFYRHTKN